jgi:hypothetical protein
MKNVGLQTEITHVEFLKHFLDKKKKTTATSSQAVGSPRKATERTSVDDGDDDAPYA